MGYSLRSPAELGIQARGFFTQSIPGAVAALAPNTFTVVAKVLALLGFEHEQRRAWLFRQTFASTADDLWLARHGFELGIARTPASVASGTVMMAATPGVPVPAGLLFVRPDGLTLTTVAGATSSASTVTLPIEPDLAGLTGNTDAGTVLTLDPSSAIVAGLGTTAVVNAPGLTGGSDAETLEIFRQRILTRKRRPPQGGSSVDYGIWAREALPSILDVYVDRFVPNAGRVWMTFTVTDQLNGIPSAGQVALVQAYVNDPVRRPVTAEVTVLAPTPVPVPVTIADLRPDNQFTRTAVAAELAGMFADRAEPGRPSGDFTFSASWIDEAISRATGENSHRRVLPASDVVFASSYKPVLGPITFTS